MNQILTLELSELAFTAIQQQAAAVGISPEHLAATLLEQRLTQLAQPPQFPLGETSKTVTRTRFDRHFGTLKLDPETTLENERIDTDLAKEYANLHEDE
jgi:hypothetical protein